MKLAKIATILANLESKLAVESPELAHKLGRMLDIRTASLREDLVTDLNDFSKAIANYMKVEPAVPEIGAILEQMSELARSMRIVAYKATDALPDDMVGLKEKLSEQLAHMEELMDVYKEVPWQNGTSDPIDWNFHKVLEAHLSDIKSGIDRFGQNETREYERRKKFDEATGLTTAPQAKVKEPSEQEAAASGRDEIIKKYMQLMLRLDKIQAEADNWADQGLQAEADAIIDRAAKSQVLAKLMRYEKAVDGGNVDLYIPHLTILLPAAETEIGQIEGMLANINAG